MKWPYAPLFFHVNGKNVENRTHQLPLGWLAVYMCRTPFSDAEVAAHGKAELIRSFQLLPFADTPDKGCILGFIFISAITFSHNNPWAMAGHFQCEISHASALQKALPCRGEPGVWRVPAAVAELIEKQLVL